MEMSLSWLSTHSKLTDSPDSLGWEGSRGKMTHCFCYMCRAKGRAWYIPSHIIDTVKTSFLHKCLQYLDLLYCQVHGECFLSYVVEWVPSFIIPWFHWLCKGLFRTETTCNSICRSDEYFTEVQLCCLYILLVQKFNAGMSTALANNLCE